MEALLSSKNKPSYEKLKLVDELPWPTKSKVAPHFRKKKPNESRIIHSLGSNEHNKIVSMLNPDPLPYQAKIFKSSTVTKLVNIPRRHADPFNPTNEGLLSKQKGLILHSNRYEWEAVVRNDKTTQRDRLVAEEEEFQRAKNLKRLREALNYRTKFDLLLGGESLLHKDRLDQSMENETTSIPNKSEPIQSEMNIPNVPPNLSEQWNFDTLPVTLSPIGGRQVKLLDRISHSSQDHHERHFDQNKQKNDHNSDEWHLPKIPFPFYQSMISTGRSSADWNSYLLRQQNTSKDIFSGPLFTKSSETLESRPFGRPIQTYIMDGNRATMNERSNIMEELAFLKSIVLPPPARDLYVGRGIKLPPTHVTLNPRPLPGTSARPNQAADSSSAYAKRSSQTIKMIHENGSNVLITMVPEEETYQGTPKYTNSGTPEHDMTTILNTDEMQIEQKTIENGNFNPFKNIILSDPSQAVLKAQQQESIELLIQLSNDEEKLQYFEQFSKDALHPELSSGQICFIKWLYQQLFRFENFSLSQLTILCVFSDALLKSNSLTIKAMESLTEVDYDKHGAECLKKLQELQNENENNTVPVAVLLSLLQDRIENIDIEPTTLLHPIELLTYLPVLISSTSSNEVATIQGNLTPPNPDNSMTTA